jgi:signal transduction histidine kinase
MERAARVREDLERLRPFARKPGEAESLAEAASAFERYGELVAEERALVARGERRRALALAEREARERALEVETGIERLMEATYARMFAAQAEAARLEARTWTAVLVALGAAVGLALLGTAVVARRMTRSLQSLSAATAKVATGAFRDPIAVGSHDELGDLAQSFNAMAAQIRRMEETKDEFFAMISHELRSPLTSVREAAHLLRDEVPGPLTEKQARLVQIVGTSSDRLLRLVNQILELSGLRAGTLPLERRELDLERVVGRAVEELRPQAEEGGLAIHQERVGQDFQVLGDEERLVEVVVNLVANAIRFTPRGGRILIRLVSAGPELELQVEDTGAGIPAGDLPYIFESYRQAGRDRRGTGLGLAIVRGIVQAHGGRVTVESHEGKGSRFTVLLPRPRPSA